MGDDVLDDVGGDNDSRPAQLPTVHRNFDFGDEAPPIPAHTMASMELVEQTKSDKAGRGVRGGGSGMNKAPQEPLSSTYDVLGAATEGVYEQPAPPTCKFMVF